METQIAQIVANAVKQAFDVAVTPQISLPEAKYGDYSSNVAFSLAKALKQAPNELAQKLAGAIKDPSVAKAEAAGGFVNLTMADKFWISELKKIDANYGKIPAGKGQKVQVEFISANPTGPLTLGNARGGFIGDVLANVLEWLGNDVTREYYFNDAGTQINRLVKSIKIEAGIEKDGEQEYKGAYIKELARDLEPYLEKGDDELAIHATQMIFERYIRDAIEKMHIHFDHWFNEKHLVESGQTQRAIDRLRDAGLIYEKDGAVWLAIEKLGGDRDRVLIKSNEGADLTYLVNDIPYHFNIFEERKFDWAIKILGTDHHGQIQSLILPVKYFLPDKHLDVVLYQLVRLIKGGKEVKMSKRAGTYVTTDELIDEVGADVARFFFLMRSSDSHMDFDLDLAKEQSQKNPFWYLMYSSARAHSILRQAAERKLLPGKAMAKLTAQEKALVRQMSQLPELLQQIGGDYAVHRLTFFGVETAKLFHDYYEGTKIIDLPDKEAEEKLYLIQQYIHFLEAYSSVLGVTPLQQM